MGLILTGQVGVRVRARLDLFGGNGTVPVPAPSCAGVGWLRLSKVRP